MKRYRIEAEVVLYVDAPDEDSARGIADSSLPELGYVERFLEVREDDEDDAA